MGNISVSLPSDGTVADVSDYNTPVTTIVNEINGNLDNSNIASDAAIDGSKLADGTVGTDTLGTSVVTADKIDFTTFSGTTTQWRSWTPTLTNFTGTVNQARYTLVGKTCHFYIEVTQGASTSGRHTFSLPVQASAAIISNFFGWGIPVARGEVLDSGAQAYDAFGGITSSTTIGLGYMLSVSNIVAQSPTSPTAPMVWASGVDKFWLYGSYETV